MLGNMIANTFIKPFQSPVFDNPKNYGLTYEDVTFTVKDGVELSGWLIKGSKEKVIIQSHFGVQCCRSGYTLKGNGWIKGYDEDVRFLRQAKYLNDAGYTVLMYDFRNHGNSGKGTLPWVSWGPEEAKDVIAAVDFISTHPEYKQASIGLFSICMGHGLQYHQLAAFCEGSHCPHINDPDPNIHWSLSFPLMKALPILTMVTSPMYSIFTRSV